MGIPTIEEGGGRGADLFGNPDIRGGGGGGYVGILMIEGSLKVQVVSRIQA